MASQPAGGGDGRVDTGPRELRMAYRAVLDDGAVENWPAAGHRLTLWREHGRALLRGKGQRRPWPNIAP